MSMQDLLRMLVDRTGLQTNAQQGLPVTPNNGNPGGAHNMPWMQPSPYMDHIRNMLQQRAQNLNTKPMQVAGPMQTGGGMQPESVVLPNTKPLQIGGPTMPMSTGGVLPPEQVAQRPVLPRQERPSFGFRGGRLPSFNPEDFR